MFTVENAQISSRTNIMAEEFASNTAELFLTFNSQETEHLIKVVNTFA